VSGIRIVIEGAARAFARAAGSTSARLGATAAATSPGIIAA
jgi:hypothetical protein